VLLLEETFCFSALHVTETKKVHVLMRGYKLKDCECDILQITCGNCTKFTVQLKMNWLHF